MRAGINNDTQLINVEMLQHWVEISRINLLQNPNLVSVGEKVRTTSMYTYKMSYSLKLIPCLIPYKVITLSPSTPKQPWRATACRATDHARGQNTRAASLVQPLTASDCQGMPEI